MIRILSLDDESAMLSLLSLIFERKGYEHLSTTNTYETWAMLHTEAVDLFTQDLMRPDIDGWEFYQAIRSDETLRALPIIIITARNQIFDKNLGFSYGVNAYITKPFSPRELLARIKAVLRRSQPMDDEKPLEVEGLSLDPLGHRVLSQGKQLQMGPTEYRLLQFFMTHPERVFSRTQLLDQVWGYDYHGDLRVVDAVIKRLRFKLRQAAPNTEIIITVRGVGYRFRD